MALPLSPPPSRSASQVSLNKMSPPQPTTLSPPHSPKRRSRPVLKLKPCIYVPPIDSPALRSFFSPCSSDEESDFSEPEVEEEEDDGYGTDLDNSTPLSMRPLRRSWASRVPPTPPPQSPPPNVFTPSRRPSLASPTFGSPQPQDRRQRRHTDPTPAFQNLEPTPSLTAAISLRDTLTVQTQKAHLRRSHPQIIASLHRKLETARVQVELATIEARALEELRMVAEARKRIADSYFSDDDDEEEEEEEEEDVFGEDFFNGGVFESLQPQPTDVPIIRHLHSAFDDVDSPTLPASSATRPFEFSIAATLASPKFPKLTPLTTRNIRKPSCFEEIMTPLEFKRPLEENEFNIPLPSPSFDEICFFATRERGGVLVFA